MPAGRARITIDLTPERRRELKTAAAKADMTMREFVTESVRRDLQRARRAMASDAPATDGARQRLASAAPVAAVNEAQHGNRRAAQHGPRI